MKNKIYPFLLGLSCIVIVALVSFKNNEKTVEKERMIITVVSQGVNGNYNLYVTAGNKYESVKAVVPKGEYYNYAFLLNRMQEYEREGWNIKNSNMLTIGSDVAFSFILEREKK